MLRLISGAVLGAVVFAGAAQAQDTLSALSATQSLYAEATAPRTDLGRWFTTDMATAMETDLAQRQPDLSADYRFDLPERPRGELVFTETTAANGAGVRVEVDGQVVLVELCRRNDGLWRIVDIRDPDELWATRAYLSLPAGQVSCE